MGKAANRMQNTWCKQLHVPIPKQAVINHWVPDSIENPLPLNFSSLLTERGEWANRSHFEKIFAQILDSEQNSSRIEDPAIAMDYHFLHFWDLSFGLCLLNKGHLCISTIVRNNWLCIAISFCHKQHALTACHAVGRYMQDCTMAGVIKKWHLTQNSHQTINVNLHVV